MALGFGAQSLVRDFLSGLFVLLENPYDVGDLGSLSVAWQKIEGRVGHVTLRSTDVRDPDEVRHVVPNGQIQWAANRSRGAFAGPDLEEAGTTVDTVRLAITAQTRPDRREEVERVIGTRVRERTSPLSDDIEVPS